jgi:alkylhydroperoxidase family enzyme
MKLYPDNVKKLVAKVLQGAGHTPAPLRQAVEAAAACDSGARRPDAALPADLQAYVAKVSRHAYKITDQDVDALKEAGYSEDAIYEITVCAALGAALARLECGFDALKEQG